MQLDEIIVFCPAYDLRNVRLFRPVTSWTRTHQTLSHLRMPLQRMLAGAGGGIPDLNSAVTAPGGHGRRLLVQDCGLRPTAI